MSDENDEGDDHEILPAGSENNGRWTRQEHNLFLEGIEKFGKVQFKYPLPHGR